MIFRKIAKFRIHQYYYSCTIAAALPYSWKFSRDPIFTEGPSSKISRSNFRRWTFQNCSTHNIACMPTIMVTPPADRACADHCTDFYFADLIFVDCCSTVKTAKNWIPQKFLAMRYTEALAVTKLKIRQRILM